MITGPPLMIINFHVYECMYTPFLRFIKNGLDLNMETTRVTDLDDYSKTWLMDLLRANMKDMYEKSEWGWNEKNKAEEMFDDSAWYVNSAFLAESRWH